MDTSTKNEGGQGRTITVSEMMSLLSAKPLQDDLSTLTQSLKKSSVWEEYSIIFVQTVAGVTELLEELTDLPTEPPSLYIDLEGVNLSRHGTISIIQIFVYPIKRTFLVDIHTLKGSAFSAPASNGSLLHSILESPSIPKVFFDVRNDSDALFSHYQITLAGVQDIQLMELAQRSFNRRCVNNLGKCIEYDASLTPDERKHWKSTKDTGRKLFCPEQGGSYDVFNIRPLSDEIIQYCAQDVQFLPRLWHKYDRAMSQRWKAKVEEEVRNRIELSKSSNYIPEGRHRALAPKGWA